MPDPAVPSPHDGAPLALTPRSERNATTAPSHLVPAVTRSVADVRRDHVDRRLLRRVHRHSDDAARTELTRRFLPLVRSFARRYAGRGEDLEDLTQVGLVGLVKAIDRFDPDAGYRFVSFAVPNITGEIRRHFPDHCWSVHVPRAMQELDAKVFGTRTDLAAATGRDPSDRDLADALGLPMSDIVEARSVRKAYRARSTNVAHVDGTMVFDTHGSLDAGYGLVDDVAMLRQILTVLDDRERTVLRLRFYDDLLQREIAALIGVSQMQVSRIIAGAIERMRKHLHQSGDLVLGTTDELLASDATIAAS